MGLMACTHGRRRLVIHMRSCRPGNTAKPVGAPTGAGGAGAPTHPKVIAKSGVAPTATVLGTKHYATEADSHDGLPRVTSAVPNGSPTKGVASPSVTSPPTARPSPPPGRKTTRARPPSQTSGRRAVEPAANGHSTARPSANGGNKAMLMQLVTAKVERIESSMSHMQAELTELKLLLAKLEES